MEYNDVYDKDRNPTGRVHRRDTPWGPDEFGIVPCIWVHNGRGELMMTRRAPGKIFAGTWENTGGAAQVGEDSITAALRELREETGIHARQEDLEFLDTDRERSRFYDHYCLCWDHPIGDIVLQPGETDDAKWVTFGEVHEMIRRKEICDIIAKQFLYHEAKLLKRQSAQD